MAPHEVVLRRGLSISMGGKGKKKIIRIVVGANEASHQLINHSKRNSSSQQLDRGRKTARNPLVVSYVWAFEAFTSRGSYGQSLIRDRSVGQSSEQFLTRTCPLVDCVK